MSYINIYIFVSLLAITTLLILPFFKKMWDTINILTSVVYILLILATVIIGVPDIKSRWEKLEDKISNKIYEEKIKDAKLNSIDKRGNSKKILEKK